jgi:hypothetical protein
MGRLSISAWSGENRITWDGRTIIVASFWNTRMEDVKYAAAEIACSNMIIRTSSVVLL